MDQSARNIELIERSFDVVSLKSDQFTERFYHNLFTDYPQTRSLFKHVDLVRQRKKLFAMLTLVVTHLSRMDIVTPVLMELGRRHVRYGVASDAYEAFIATFLKTVGEIAPDQWDRDVAEAWRTVLRRICVHMTADGSGGAGQARGQSEELRLLMEISGQATVSSVHTRLFETFLAKKVQDHDLEIARDVQRALLPDCLPEVEEYDIRTCYDPARAVGGDYYDCFRLDSDRICVSFGDVCGKGVGAAIIMSRLASAVQTTMRFADDVREAVSAINSHMCHRMLEGRFVTFVLLVLDHRKHSLTMVNAGHRPPIVLMVDGTEELGQDSAGLPLGVADGHDYDALSRPICAGETMLLFTDGVDEALNPSGEQYGVDRVKEVLQRFSGPAAELGAALLDDVRRHADGRPQSDDITIMTIGRRAG